MILNAFSLNMITELPASIHIKELSLDEAKIEAKNRISAVGHKDTASIFSSILDINVAFNRTSVIINKNSTVLIGQYYGPRLAEGVTTLPENATIKWLLVTIS